MDVSTFWFSALIPLVYIGQFPGLTLCVAILITIFTFATSKIRSPYKVKMIICIFIMWFYGVYDIYVYFSKIKIRLDLLLLGPIYYWALLYWFLLYKENKRSKN